MNLLENKTVLITGAARRIGAQTARTLHENGANLIIHYRESMTDAQNLTTELNQQRANSAVSIAADLAQTDPINQLAKDAVQAFGKLDILINNASRFYPTKLGDIDENNWHELVGSNFKAPLFLSQACYPALKASHGQIINMIDIHARKPLKNHTVYCCAKAANAMLVRSLAQEMAPEVRVNGVSPGAILWPENQPADENTQQSILNNVPLARSGKPQNIADTILFLINNDYINGQIIAVDGGRQLF